MKVGFMSLDWSDLKDRMGHPTPGGAGYYRCALPARYLAENGTQTVYGPNCVAKPSGELTVVDHNNVRHDNLDVIVVQRWMDRRAARAIARAVACGQTIINDVDDHYEGLDTANAAFYHTHPLLNPNHNRELYRQALNVSSAITVSTDFLARKMERHGKPVFVIPNMIDLDRWNMIPVEDLIGPAVIGWVGVTAFRSGDLEILRGVLEPFMRRNPEVRFHHSGHARALPPVWEKLGLTRPSGVAMMDSILEYPSLFKFFNIGLVPLSNKPFNEAKSNIKGIEYAACGMPGIASGTKEYETLAERKGILLARKPKHWLSHMERLLHPQERFEVGRRARLCVEEHYDIALNWRNWLSCYEDAVAR